MTEPKNINLQWFAEEGNVESGSAEGGKSVPANAEELLNSAINGDAGADGAKPEAKPAEGDKAAGGTHTESGNQTIKLAAWAEQLNPEIRNNPELASKLAKFSKVSDVAKAYLDLEVKLAANGIPGKDATAEEIASYWEKAGRPKTAAGYKFASEKEGVLFAEAAFKSNLTSAQAEALYKNLGEAGKQALQAAEKARAQKAKETAEALAAEYGSKYQEKLELLKRGLTAAGPNVGKLLSQAGLAGNPEILKAFIAFGQMTAESGAARGSGAGDSLKSIMEGGSFNFNTSGF